MLELLTNIINSQIFAPFVIVWLIICFANQNARESFLKRLSILISKPIIFKEDEFPNDYVFYPRRLLEQTSMMFRDALHYPLRGVIEQFTLWIKLQVSLASSSNRPLRVVGYFIYLAFFILFAWANAIGIVTSLDLLNIFSGQVPQLLTSFEVAVFMGSLGSIVVAGLVLMDIQSERSMLSNWDEHGRYWQLTARIVAVIIIIFAVIIVMSLGLQRLVTLGLTENNEALKFFTNFAILALVPINNILTTILISYEAILGILVVLIAIQIPLLGTMYLINLISLILGTMLPLLIDVIYRFALLSLDLLFYIILTPIDTVIGAPIRLIEKSTKRDKDS